MTKTRTVVAAGFAVALLASLGIQGPRDHAEISPTAWCVTTIDLGEDKPTGTPGGVLGLPCLPRGVPAV